MNSTIRYLPPEKSYILPSHLMYGKSSRFSFSSLLFFDKVFVKKSPVVDFDIWAGLGHRQENRRLVGHFYDMKNRFWTKPPRLLAGWEGSLGTYMQ